jgi:hypothetical protein
MWKNKAEPDRPQMTIRRMRVAYWITKATDSHSEYVTLLLKGGSGYANAPQCCAQTYIPVLFPVTVHLSMLHID